MSELDQYDYTLPRELIAQHPLPERDDARLLVVDRRSGELEHLHVRDLPELLDPADRLVVNDTRVAPARLVGYRTLTRGRWEGLYLGHDERGVWMVLGKTRGKIEPGETVTLRNEDGVDCWKLTLLAALGGGHWAARPERAGEPLALLEEVGRIPLPHYIRGGEMQPSDRQQYQTMFADQPGAVAAPTAGLHFTPRLVERLSAKGVGIGRVTLHVGEGTFRPVAVDRLDDHVMHAEWCSIAEETAERLNQCRQAGGRVVAVGTTAARTLETAADQSGDIRPFEGQTDLFIRPGHVFRGVDALLTNFHLPRSTLLVLVRAFGGDALIRRAYDEAIAQRYRFYSYGDAMFIR